MLIFFNHIYFNNFYLQIIKTHTKCLRKNCTRVTSYCGIKNYGVIELNTVSRYIMPVMVILEVERFSEKSNLNM